MPCIIEFVDAISRKKQRGVLYVNFSPEPRLGSNTDDDDIFDLFPINNWETLPVRQQVIDWLNENAIAWQPCGSIANPSVMLSYQGQIYIDIPYDKELPAYQKLAAFLENPDGSMRLPGVEFWHLSLEIAMQNAHHDEPGYWEKWADTF